ncbi:hypothetical protein BC835DRAFT_433354 [Cytidiella melzeri]|nr:hypothetical protein BC835DRAFT_433354 [Cytidiella melzeri]
MLPRAWLAGKSSDDHDSSQPLQASESVSDGRGKSSKLHPRRPTIVDRAITAAISTPHDSLLAELHGQRPDINTSAKIDADLSVLPTIPSVGSLERPGASPGPGVRSSTASPNTSPEPVYDPFSGGLAYILPGPHERDSPPFEQAKDELWSQLGRIRELQSEIATMHTNMEGVGAGDSRKTKRAPTRAHSDTIVGEEWPDLAEIEQEQNKARDTEFASLSQAFDGRHTAIGKIMDKLDELSKTLSAFHALPTPSMAFTSRNNTGTMYSNPSPSPTSPASPPMGSSPVSHHNVPNTLQAVIEKLEIPRAESPESG